MGHDANGQHEFFDIHMLVRHVAAVGVAREVDAKRHGVGHHLGIGAAADGDRCGVFFAADLAVWLEQLFNQLAVFFNKQAVLVFVGGHLQACPSPDSFDLCFDTFTYSADGEADIQGKRKMIVF